MPDGGIFSGPMAAGLLGLGGAQAAGVGNNGYRAGSFEQDGGYNPDAFNYGGSAGAAKAQAGLYGALGAGAQDRNAAQLDPTQMNQSRGAEMDALGMQRAAALGQVPSAAEIQMHGAMEDNARQQASAAASARGPAAMAMAQYGANANTAAANQGIAYQTGQLRANEMANARNAYMQGAGQIRSGDFGAASANLAANMQQRGLNDNYSLGMYGLQNQVNTTQLGAQVQQQGLLANSQAQANAINAGVNQSNADNQWTGAKLALGGLQGVAGGKAMMGAGGGGPPPVPA